ncbi:hypothetical protein [Halobacteriovorax sp. DPLXC-1]|uniref:hypothetical protein n=1 Tax=Halobacteriovorax sp. DPLXC-1 TaxID=3110771 RepID=UPI002FEF5507
MIKLLISLLFLIFQVSSSALTGSDIIRLKPKNFETKELNSFNFSDIYSDTINFRSSGVKKINKHGNPKAIENAKDKAKKEEMVFFTYGDDEKKKVNKAKPVLRPTVALKNKARKAVGKPKNYKPIIDFSSFIQSAAKRTKAASTFNIKLREFNHKGPSKNNLSDYDLVPSYNLNELLTDAGSSVIKVPIAPDDKFSTFRASVAARGIIRTNFELSARSDTTFDIPVISADYLDKILEKNKIKEETGAHILVDLGSKIDTSTFTGKFKKKIFLNKNFKQIEPGGSFVYELYLDVELGNHLIKYMDFKGKVAQKIIHLVQDEMTYEAPYLLSSKAVNFSVFEENLAAKTLQQMNLDAKSINYFNRDIKPTKVGLNRYKLIAPIREAGFKHYLEVGKETPVFVGFDDIKKIVIPSLEYIDYLKELFQNYADNGACVIQINLDRPLVNFEAYMSSLRPSGSYDFYYMDKDGTVSAEITGLTEKVFVISHDYGILNTKIDSGNGNINYMQSFCTEGLYIIEHI